MSKTPPNPIQPPVPAEKVYYRHKTVSVPEEAYNDLYRLREMVASPGAVLPEVAREFLDEQMAAGAQKYTFGTVFWMACKMAIAELEKSK